MRPRGSGTTALLSPRRRATLSDSGLLSRLATEGIHVRRPRRACRASPGTEKVGALVSIECDGEARLAMQIIRLQSQKQTSSVLPYDHFPVTVAPTKRESLYPVSKNLLVLKLQFVRRVVYIPS